MPTGGRSAPVLRAPPSGYGDHRLALRLLAPADEPAFLAGLRDEGVSRHAYGGALPATPAAVAAHIARVPERLAADEALLMAVLDPGGDRFLGLTMLFGHDPRRRRAEIGFWLVPAARGRGLAAAAVSLTLGWAFDGLGLAIVEGLTGPDNRGAQRAMEAAGMRRDPAVAPPPGERQRARYVGYSATAP